MRRYTILCTYAVYTIYVDNYVHIYNESVQISKQLKNITLKYIVGGINRHYNSNIDLFTDVLECNLCKFRQSNTAGIAGDTNIDLSKYNEHLCTNNYVNI